MDEARDLGEEAIRLEDLAEYRSWHVAEIERLEGLIAEIDRQIGKRNRAQL